MGGQGIEPVPPDVIPRITRQNSPRNAGVRTPHSAGESSPQVHDLGQPRFSSSERLSDVAGFVALAAGVDEDAARRILAMVRDALVDEPELGVTEAELAAALRRRL